MALFGTTAQKWEAVLWRDSRWRGALFAASPVGAVVGCGIVASRIASRSGLLCVTMTASATWAVLGAKSLAAEAHAVHKLLDRGDLAGGRNLSLGERCCLALTMRSDPPEVLTPDATRADLDLAARVDPIRYNTAPAKERRTARK